MLHLTTDSIGQLRTKLYYKRSRDDFNFLIVNFPIICTCSNITAVVAFGAYISQLIWYSRACGSYHHDFLNRWLMLTRKLLYQAQGFQVVKMKSSLRKFKGLNDLVNPSNIFASHDHRYVVCLNHNPVLSSFITYHQVSMLHQVFNKSNTTGVTSGAGTAYPSGALKFTRLLRDLLLL